MIELEQALSQILNAVPVLGPETVPLSRAMGRFLAASIPAPLDLPPFDNSAMDGYAVRAAEVSTANLENPVLLRVIGEVPAGRQFEGKIEASACVRIFTGSPLPTETDAVVMQEATKLENGSGRIRVLEAVKPWENVRFRGEDVKKGASLGEPGMRMTAGCIALFAALGMNGIMVGKKPKAGLIAAGSELLEPGEPLAGGKIYESNRAALAALLQESGAEIQIYPLVADDPEASRLALGGALKECDVVISSGGVSVGEYDFVKAAFTDLGGELAFWKVAIKPGKPFVFGRWQQRLFFGLPGNPVSAFVTFLLLVRPALLRMQGVPEVHLPRHPGTLAETIENRGDRRHFVRVTIDAAGMVRSAGPQASHRLEPLAKSNGLIDVPPRTVFEPGRLVAVLRWAL